MPAGRPKKEAVKADEQVKEPSAYEKMMQEATKTEAKITPVNPPQPTVQKAQPTVTKIVARPITGAPAPVMQASGDMAWLIHKQGAERPLRLSYKQAVRMANKYPHLYEIKPA